MDSGDLATARTPGPAAEQPTGAPPANWAAAQAGGSYRLETSFARSRRYLATAGCRKSKRARDTYE
jgi:hypothetical protein